MRVERIVAVGYTLLHRLRNRSLQEIPSTSTMEDMGKFGLNTVYKLVKSAGVVAVLSGLQFFASSVAHAAPPNGRMNQDERHRLRQEVRQHSGDYPRPPVHAAPPANPTSAPLAVPQGRGPQGGPPHPQTIPLSGPPGAGGNPGEGRVVGPAPGRLSEDDRRALRQQLREQRMQREAVGGQGPAEGARRP